MTKRKRNYLAIMEALRHERFTRGLSQPHDPVHWACQDCGMPCRCQEPQTRHADCGHYEP